MYTFTVEMSLVHYSVFLNKCQMIFMNEGNYNRAAFADNETNLKIRCGYVDPVVSI